LRIILYYHALLVIQLARNVSLLVHTVLYVKQVITSLTIPVYLRVLANSMLTRHLKFAKPAQAVATLVSTIPIACPAPQTFYLTESVSVQSAVLHRCMQTSSH
jgi:hypothetical protein